ncbi:MAG: ATP-grasp domain-containing protein [Lachnospiraceae bacterium]|nr:ATP-grasp domain-containing protein [Lachnospiraceae bacterium]
MNRILIIGAGDFQLPLVQKASEQYEVLLAAPVISDAFLPYISGKFITDVRDREAILAYARTMDICGVTTDQTDIAVRSVAYVAEQLGLPGIGYETGCLFTDKSLMRQKMAELGIPLLPNRTVFSPEEALSFYGEIGGDVIIKPLDTQGSRGVQVCRSAAELRDKYAEASRWSSNGAVIVERFATGREFVVEGLAVDYEFRNLCIGDTLYFDLPDAFAAKSRIFPTTADEALAQRVLDLNTRICTGFGLRQGITHSEFIMDGGEIYLIETAARGGGVFISSDLISLSTGLQTEQFLLDIATGRQKGLPKILPQQCVCGYMAFYIPVGEVVRVSGVEEVQSLPYVHRNQLEKLRAGIRNEEGHTDKTSRIALIVSAPDRDTLNERMAHIRSVLQADVKTPDGTASLIWE